ncbi:DUF4831 family protein [Xylanibacter muris]|uniref:DUF4831 family protein n=1 Tax=Xylanibacter muris TaxID=2736290 RepID=A0ABX2API4_9BACT|nr:DUF4831 family protein [Xylanibacter muris]NPD91927.1 DUF4831 family protein [Xylanibacter muris]
MKNLLLACLLLTSGTAAAQSEISKYEPGVTPEGAIYYLPKTALRIAVQVEKTTYTPGDFAKYAERYLRVYDVSEEKQFKYKITNIGFSTFGVADTSKCFAVRFDPKSSATNVTLADDGTLLAINSDPIVIPEPKNFTAAPKPASENPRKYLNEEIISAGNTAKMAELTAQEIYEIRESKNMLNRGEADFMPKDGEQLRIMLANLNHQDNMLTSLFCGTITKDTTEHVFVVCPDKNFSKGILFRLSEKLGIVDPDDLSGTPYYLTIEDLKTVHAQEADPKAKKKDKISGIYVNIPGKIKATIYNGAKATNSYELHAGQFGNTELLSSELFNKRFTTKLTLNPTTGSVAKLDASQLK